jgi:hypothetical protein
VRSDGGILPSFAIANLDDIDNDAIVVGFKLRVAKNVEEEDDDENENDKPK